MSQYPCRNQCPTNGGVSKHLALSQQVLSVRKFPFLELPPKGTGRLNAEDSLAYDF